MNLDRDLSTVLLFAIFFSPSFGYEAGLRGLLQRKSRDCPIAKEGECSPDITYWLYTRENRDGTQLLEGALNDAPFVDEQLKILIHGHWNDRDSGMNTALRNAYFDHGEYNIISVDWSVYVKEKCYYQAVVSIDVISGCISDFINKVVKSRDFGHVHLLGHSLGAHVAARVSDSFRSPPLNRLTRFDPALPLFLNALTRKGTAQFKDVYHSNSAVLGQTPATGDVDVYFNNGSFQPGCECILKCSHLRGVLYFAESITSGMKGFRCSSWQRFVEDRCQMPRSQDLLEVGEHVNPNTRGSFMVFTKPNPPYMYSPKDYLNPVSFKKFKASGQGQCDFNDVVQLVKDYFT